MITMYFGCHGEAGHHLWRPWKRGYMKTNVPRQEREQLPWEAGQLDGGLQPEDKQQPEGLCCVHQRAGWTAMAFWDRSGDKRMNSCSVVLAEGDHDFPAMRQIFEQNFPEVWDRVTAKMDLLHLSTVNHHY